MGKYMGIGYQQHYRMLVTKISDFQCTQKTVYKLQNMFYSKVKLNIR